MPARRVSLLVLVFAGSASPVLAGQDAPENPVAEVIRASDDDMTCQQMADEAAQLSENMGGEHGGGVFRTLGGVAKSGAALLIPGAGLALAGADAMTQGARERREAEDEASDRRWYYLNGLYAGNQCGHTAQAQPASALVASPATPTIRPATLVTPTP